MHKMIETLELSEAASMNALFEEAKTALTSVLSNRQSYQLAATSIIEALTTVAHLIEDPERPVHVLVDIYPNDPRTGHLTAHNDGAWMVINFEKAIAGDWGSLSDSEMSTTIFRIAQAFSQEMQHYRQYLRNWEYFTGTGADCPSKTCKSDAATAARELIAHYGSAKDALANLKTCGSASETMVRVLNTSERCDVKRFLCDLYTHLRLG